MPREIELSAKVTASASVRIRKRSYLSTQHLAAAAKPKRRGDDGRYPGLRRQSAVTALPIGLGADVMKTANYIY